MGGGLSLKGFFRDTSKYLLIIVLIMLAIRVFNPATIEEAIEMDVTDIVTDLKDEKVDKIWMRGNYAQGELKNGTEFEVFLPDEIRSDFYDYYLKDQVEAEKISFGGEPRPTTPWYISMIPTLLVMVIFGIFWFSIMQRSQGGGGGKNVMNFGKSKAKLHEEDPANLITFEDVAGLEEEKEELKEIVDFLKNPKRYIDIGARIPKGVLMVGPPGTGKTYLSRAVAGESGVPFFTMSGSDFVEMFVGVGASRVRDLFEEAKKNAPCIIFIDEIDAVGRKRGAGMGGGHDEREQTLNQLLVEMDGFGTNEGIIVMAATNRPDILDTAILRPGRFDRTINVDLPDVRGREAILKVHSKEKPLAEDVDLEIIAKRTPGFSPADLENLLNEAALLSARKALEKIPMEMVEEASIKVQAGPEKKSRVISEKERKLTAYHEAGHALTAKLIPDADPVHMITIIPRGRAGGFTAYIPDEDSMYMTKGELKDRLVILLGGRVAEALIMGDISTGAQNDIERATKIVREMITHYGMNEKLGPMTYGSDEDEVFMGRDFGRTPNYSNDIAAIIDEEMRILIDDAYDRAEILLSENIDMLHEIAEALLEKETLNAEEFEAICSGEKQAEDIIEASAEEIKEDAEEVNGEAEEDLE